MKLYKRAAGIALSLLMSMQVCGSVFADNTYSDTEDNENTVQTEVNDAEVNENNDDPSYGKYVQRQFMNFALNKSIWGSSDITHSSHFNGYEKKYGIDVSYYQGNIDWKKVKDSGVEYVIIRAGYRGYGSAGTLVKDARFADYIKGAKSVGLDVGVYFYTQAINTAEAKEEAQFVLNLIKGYELELPVYYDIEGVDYDTGRLDSANLTKAQKTNLCKAFCDTIRANGYEAGVYTNYSWFLYQVDGKALGSSYPIWLAHYTTSTDYPYEYQMWQYTGQGKVNGISSSVDMNVHYVKNQNDYSSKKVTNLGKTDIAQTKVMLKWDAVPGAQGYAVYTKNSDGTYTFNRACNTTECTVTGLKMANVYTFNVRPYFNDDGSKEFLEGKSQLGGFSNDFVQGTKTIKAYGVTVTGKTANTISIKWDPAVGKYNGYQVALYDTTARKHIAVAYTNDIKYTYKNLDPLTNYNVTVRPYYVVNGVKYPGVFADYVTTSTTSSRVTGLKADAFYGTDISLSWNSVPSASKYNIYIVKDGKAQYLKSANSCSALISGAKQGQSYTYAVKAVRKSNDKETVIAKSNNYTIKFSYSNPGNVTISNIKQNQATVSWSKVPYITSYRVYLYSDKTKTYKFYSTVSASAANVTITGLKSKSNYKVKIYSVYGPGISSGIIKSFKTK